MLINRRQFGKISALALMASGIAALPGVSLASNPTGKRLHGLSAFGELRYPADYARFDFVNPNAPKGGTLNFGVPNWGYNQNPQTFDTLNSFVLKGNAPPRMELCFDTLMTAALDEASALYGSVAETVEISNDRNTYTFHLRSEPRWHDGTPLTAHDVAFSYELLKKDGHPQLALSLNTLEKAEALDDRTVVLTFNGKQSDRAILAVAVMPILSKAFYTANSFADTTMTPPLTSGAYKVKQVNAGNFIEYERVKDYWAKDMPFQIGQGNFDTLRIEFYRDRQAAFEAFKKGQVTFREEFTSKTWATEYDFPAMKEGRVVQKLFPAEKVPSFQGWAVNRRLDKFKDNRTVEAVGLCFDFEWTNKNFFYESYSRTHSFFTGSELQAQGKPSAAELEILEPLRDQLDSSVFETAILQPASNGTGRDRKRLREASQLLKAAGWVQKGRSLVDAQGKPFQIEFLIRSPTFERILGKFVANLKLIGVDASIRLVDAAQYSSRLDTYDFDITGVGRSYGATPTQDSLEQLFGSKFAKINGNSNYPGIENAAVDALIEKTGEANSREELTVVLKALDRVLRSTHSWIPNWYSANHRVAFWDMFGYPETKPDYGFPFELYWWFDKEKAAAIGKG